MAGVSAIARSFKMAIETGDAAALVDVSNELNDSSVSESRNMVDTTRFDPDNVRGRVKEYTGALRDGSISIGGPFDKSSHFNMILGMKAALQGGVNGTQIKFELGEYGRTTGLPKTEGKGFPSQYSLTVDAAGVPMWTGAFQISGAPTYGVFA